MSKTKRKTNDLSQCRCDDCVASMVGWRAEIVEVVEVLEEDDAIKVKTKAGKVGSDQIHDMAFCSCCGFQAAWLDIDEDNNYDDMEDDSDS